jgi:hypothetical protein
MKRVLLLVAFVLSLGACLPFPIPNVGNPTPTVDIAATNQANLETSVALTLTAQPTPSPVPPTPTTENLFITPSPLASDTPEASETAADILDTPAPSSTFEVPTTTDISGTLPAPVAVGQVTATWTLAVRTYGTLPPLVPFGHITLINKAKAEAYISLHVDLDGSNTVIEYPVDGTRSIQAPAGYYRYVAWVGGREMVGEFRLKRDQDLSIVLYRDRVAIK